MLSVRTLSYHQRAPCGRAGIKDVNWDEDNEHAVPRHAHPDILQRDRGIHPQQRHAVRAACRSERQIFLQDRKLRNPKKVSANPLGDSIASENKPTMTHQLLIRCWSSSQSRWGGTFKMKMRAVASTKTLKIRRGSNTTCAGNQALVTSSALRQRLIEVQASSTARIPKTILATMMYCGQSAINSPKAPSTKARSLFPSDHDNFVCL